MTSTDHTNLHHRFNVLRRLAASGSGREIDAIEDAHGAAFSTILDHLWADCEEAGEHDLAERCERLYARVV